MSQLIGTLDRHHLVEEVEFEDTLDKHFWNRGLMAEAA